MSNFDFLPTDIAESAAKAEGHVMGDPRAACFHARFAIEAIVHWRVRSYPPNACRAGAAWSDDRVPQAPAVGEVVPRKLTTGTPSYALSNPTSPEVLVPRRLCRAHCWTTATGNMSLQPEKCDFR